MRSCVRGQILKEDVVVNLVLQDMLTTYSGFSLFSFTHVDFHMELHVVHGRGRPTRRCFYDVHHAGRRCPC